MAKAATLVLHSSCVSPNGTDDAINHSKGKFDEKVAGSGSSAAANYDNGNVSILQASITAERSHTSADHQHRYRASPHGSSSHILKSDSPYSDDHTRENNNNKDRHDHFEYISSLPIQCDVSLIPRLPITTNDGENKNYNIYSVYDSKNPSQIFNANPKQQRKQKRGHSGMVLHFPRQSFLPCGMNNVISIDQLLPPSNGHEVDVSFLLSLTQCVVITNHYDGVIFNPTLPLSDASLPVLATPSTFQFSFHNVHSSSAMLGLSRLAVGEIHVSFDHSIALEYYHKITRPRYHNECQTHEHAATCGHSMRSCSYDGNGTFPTSSKANSMIDDRSETNEVVASLRQSIMKESLLLTKALIVLGFMGVFFMVALVWLIRRIIISGKGRRLRGRRNKILASYVPSEIGVLDQSSTKHSSPGCDQASPFLSLPLMSTLRNEDSTPMKSSGEMSNGARTIHETLHLISPSKSPSIELCGAESPSNWYDDFLSPSSKLNKPHVQSRSDMSPSSKSAEENVSPNEEVFGHRLSSQINPDSAVGKVFSGNGRGTKSRSTEMLCSLSDACDGIMNKSVANGNSTSRQCLSDSAVLQDQRDIIVSSSPSSICHASDDAGSESLAVDVTRMNESSPSVETICTQNETVFSADLEGNNAIASGQLVYDRKSLNCLPKIIVEANRSRFRFETELIERVTGTKAPRQDTEAKRGDEIETGKFPSIPAFGEKSFASSLSMRVAEVAISTTSPVTPQMEACTPETSTGTRLHKKKPLTPLGSSESSQTGTTTDEFLSDYW